MHRLVARGALSACVLAPSALWACGSDDSATPSGPDGSAPDSSVPDTAPPPDSADVLDSAPTPVIYAHSTTKLYRFDPFTYSMTEVGTFSCAADLVFNIAVSGTEQIYGTTSQGLVAIDSKDASCFAIARGVYPRSLAFLPVGMADPDHEVLVGYNYAQYVSIDVSTGALTPIGALNPNDAGKTFAISGDIVAIAGDAGRMFITALGGPGGDQMLEADPKTGQVLRVVAQESELGLLGLGQWAGTGYAFSTGGNVFALDLQEGGMTQVFPPLEAGSDDGAIVFSGAGVTTRAPSQ